MLRARSRLPAVVGVPPFRTHKHAHTLERRAPRASRTVRAANTRTHAHASTRPGRPRADRIRQGAVIDWPRGGPTARVGPAGRAESPGPRTGMANVRLSGRGRTSSSSLARPLCPVLAPANRSGALGRHRGETISVCRARLRVRMRFQSHAPDEEATGRTNVGTLNLLGQSGCRKISASQRMAALLRYGNWPAAPKRFGN